jgi:thermitase
LARIGILLSLIVALSQPSILRADDLLVQLADDSPPRLNEIRSRTGGSLEALSPESKWFRWTGNRGIAKALFSKLGILRAEPNRRIRLIPNPSIAQAQTLISPAELRQEEEPPSFVDNPPLEPLPPQTEGPDPLVPDSWGLVMVGANQLWPVTSQGRGIIVALLDTGIDYNHPDLIYNLWHNPKEIPNDGIDNDGNGYVDDTIGWDFVSNDDLPYDLSVGVMEILFKHGNAGHGTHVSGILAARYLNAQGIAGVAPSIQIMALRVLDQYGEGTTANLIKAIDYAIANGAKIINASWGMEGEGPDDKALRDALLRANAKGVLVVAAAGNGRKPPGCGSASVGYDNDTDPQPAYPASYNYPNLISVAAIDAEEKLAKFSNYGKKTVHLAAPGVKILSTVPGKGYQDTIVATSHAQVSWEGTSMASPFVSGALAVIWSEAKDLTAWEVRERLLSSAAAVCGLSGKVATGGRVDLHGIRLSKQVGP